MKTICALSVLLALAVGVSPLSTSLQAQDEQPKQQTRAKKKAERKASKAAEVQPKSGLMYRASVIEDMKVWNAQGEELGEVEDLMIDFDKGQIVYAAVQYGGTIGVGGKLLAVPWKSLKVKQAKGEYFLELDVPKAKLENAAGFDKEDWPLEANQDLIK